MHLVLCSIRNILGMGAAVSGIRVYREGAEFKGQLSNEAGSVKRYLASSVSPVLE